MKISLIYFHVFMLQNYYNKRISILLVGRDFVDKVELLKGFLTPSYAIANVSLGLVASDSELLTNIVETVSYYSSSTTLFSNRCTKCIPMSLDYIIYIHMDYIDYRENKEGYFILLFLISF